jgi:hypothetical protein
MSRFKLTRPQDGNQTFGTGAPVASGSEVAGDSYIDLATRECYVFDGAAWVLSGTLAGDWTYQIVTANQPFTSATEADITQMPGFTPAANGIYEIEAKLIVSTTNSARGARPSLFTPTGMTSTPFELRSSAGTLTSDTILWGGAPGFLNQLSHPAANVGYLAHLDGVVVVGGTPGAGNVRPRMRGESATQVDLLRGSVFKYRRLA